MTEQQLIEHVRAIVDRVANNETGVAIVECAEDLAALAAAEQMCLVRGQEDAGVILFRVALALGYETRRRHESYKSLDSNIWGSALDDVAG